MGVTKRIFIENDPAFEAERERYREELSEHIAEFPERLSLVRYCEIEGKRRLDRTWPIAVRFAIKELDLDSIQVNRGQWFRTADERDAAASIAIEKHRDLFKSLVCPSKRCSRCGKKCEKG